MKQINEFLFTPWLRQDKWNGKDAVMILADVIPEHYVSDSWNCLTLGKRITNSNLILKKLDKTDLTDKKMADFINDVVRDMELTTGEIEDAGNEWYRITVITRQMVQLLVASNHQKLRTLEKSPEDWIKWAVSKNFEIPWLSWAFEKGFFGDLKAQFSTDQHLAGRYLNTNESKQITSPWGSHSTKYLTTLSEAAIKFWSNYDPTQPDTAPKNKEVSDWLRAEGISQKLAEAMATILRADGLRTGRR